MRKSGGLSGLLFGTIFMALILFAGCTINSSSEEVNRSGVTITLEREMCYGACPVYTITLYEDGSFVYEGKRCVSIKGIRKGKVSPSAVAALVTSFESANYTMLKDRYDTIDVTDGPSAITSFSKNGMTKEVYHYYGDRSAPAILSILEDQIDVTVNTQRFIGQGHAMDCMND